MTYIEDNAGGIACTTSWLFCFFVGGSATLLRSTLWGWRDEHGKWIFPLRLIIPLYLVAIAYGWRGWTLVYEPSNPVAPMVSTASLMFAGCVFFIEIVLRSWVRHTRMAAEAAAEERVQAVERQAVEQVAAVIGVPVPPAVFPVDPPRLH